LYTSIAVLPLDRTIQTVATVTMWSVNDYQISQRKNGGHFQQQHTSVATGQQWPRYQHKATLILAVASDSAQDSYSFERAVKLSLSVDPNRLMCHAMPMSCSMSVQYKCLTLHLNTTSLHSNTLCHFV